MSVCEVLHVIAKAASAANIKKATIFLRRRHLVALLSAQVRGMTSVPAYGRAGVKMWDSARVRTLKEVETADKKNVVYWMARDQRVQDNWALLHAQDLASAKGGVVSVAFWLGESDYPTARHYDFMIRGLREVAGACETLGIEFALLKDEDCRSAVSQFAEERLASCVVCDFTPLKTGRERRDGLAKAAENFSVYEVDAHNVVPVWTASDKQEVGARTLRPKIQRQLSRFLTEFPTVKKQEEQKTTKIDWDALLKKETVDKSVKPITWCDPGEKAAHAALASFASDGRLERFADDRNNPCKDGVSNLSPYFHFGQLAPQRAALEVQRISKEIKKTEAGAKVFLEEAVVRRELADNYCFYQANYDSIDGAAQWARDSLEVHASDPREHVYSREQLEDAKSHEDIWNAAQRQMVQTGKMPGFMRMYWCKKILEWTETPAEAFETALYLNDKYSIDGSDPNGYVGVAWSICGIHDMGWKERPVFGKIRYMNYAGCKRKFDIPAYVARIAKIAKKAKKLK